MLSVYGSVLDTWMAAFILFIHSALLSIVSEDHDTASGLGNVSSVSYFQWGSLAKHNFAICYEHMQPIVAGEPSSEWLD